MKNFRFGLALLLFPTIGAAQFLDARNRAMGGTGVASSHYTSAGFINPALLTMFNSSDTFGIIIPSVGAGAADKEGLVEAIENFQDEVDSLQAALSGGSPPTQKDRDDLALSLQALAGKRATIGTGVGLALSIPSKKFAWALVASSWVEGQVSVDIDPGDTAIITGATNPGALDNLASEGRILGTGVTELGLAMATEISAGGIGVLSIGATPKLQRIDTFNYPLNVTSFDEGDFTDSRYRDDKTNVNLDLGVALRPIPTVTLGLVARNLISHDVDTVVTANRRFTHTVEPEITVGAAWSIVGLTVAADVDMIEVDRFKDLVDESQFIRAGFEYNVFGWMQFRLGVQHDFEDTVSDVYTGGLGLSPFDTVHIDITGFFGDGNTYGAMAQVWFTF